MLRSIVIRVSVQAHPGSRHERIELLPDNSLAVWVRARAIEGQANAAIERAVAAALQLRPRDLKIVAGGASRRKILEIDLPNVEALTARSVACGLRPANRTNTHGDS